MWREKEGREIERERESEREETETGTERVRYIDKEEDGDTQRER